MPNIFISYRRGDSPANARLLYERLKAGFPNHTVFMDVEEIDLGDQWQAVLQARIDACDVVLVVIGRGWIDAAGASGPRRLNDPNDVVRWEIAQFLRAGKRVVPVLVDGATLPLAADLPEDLAALPGRQAHTLSHLNFDNDAQALIASLAGEQRVSRVLARLEKLVRMGKASVLVALLLGAVLLAFMWVNLFDLFGLDTRTASFTMLMGDVFFEVPLAEELLLVGIEPDATEKLGLSVERRRDYARLLELAAGQGARAVAFDLTLTAPGPFDADLANAITAANALGTQVVFGFNAFDDAAAVAIPELANSGALLGLTCVGERLGEATYATLALAFENMTYGSLPFYAAMGAAQMNSLSRDSLEVSYRDRSGAPRWIGFSLLQQIERADADCPARRPGARVARLIIRLSHRERLRDPTRRIDLEQALASWSETGSDLRGKTVLVGATHPLDMIQTRMDAEPSRYGFEFHADAINALLTDAIVRPISFAAQWFLSLLVVGLAIVWRMARLGKSQRLDLVALPVGCVLIVTISVVLYAQFGYLVVGLYHLSALIVTWWILIMLERRWRYANF